MTALRSARNAAGMILLELLVGLSVSFLVVVLVGAVYVAALNMDRRGRDLQDLGEVSVAMESLARELRRASRHPDGVVIWPRETDGITHDIVGVFSPQLKTQNGEAGAGWIYFVHDLPRRELRRIEQPGGNTAPLSSAGEGRILARNVSRFHVTRDGSLLEVTIVAVKRGRTVRLETAIWPRNE